MAQRGNADVTRPPAGDYTMIIPCLGRFAQGHQGASYPAHPLRLLQSRERYGDFLISTPQRRRVPRW
jgi:hypothetical protein